MSNQKTITTLDISTKAVEILSIIALLELHSIKSIKVENHPYMPLSLERLENINLGKDSSFPAWSFCHYGEQNGDLMRDPEMIFLVVPTPKGKRVVSAYYRNDYVGVEQQGVKCFDCSGRFNPTLINSLNSFAYSTWAKNLKSQGFIDALKTKIESERNQGTLQTSLEVLESEVSA